MRRLACLPTLLVFLIAIATNGIQANQVISDPLQSPVDIVANALDSSKANDSEFTIADDDRDDVLHVPRLRPIAFFSSEPDAAYFDFQLTYLPRLPFPQHTILQI